MWHSSSPLGALLRAHLSCDLLQLPESISISVGSLKWRSRVKDNASELDLFYSIANENTRKYIFCRRKVFHNFHPLSDLLNRETLSVKLLLFQYKLFYANCASWILEFWLAGTRFKLCVHIEPNIKFLWRYGIDSSSWVNKVVTIEILWVHS